MIRFLFVLALCFLFLPLVASVLDDPVNQVMSSGDFMERDGEVVFMSNMFWEDSFSDESYAYHYVAQTAYIFMAVHQQWAEISNSSVAEKINSTDRIACPWATYESAFVVSIPLSEICDQFDGSDYDELGEMGLFDAIQSYIEYHGDITPYSMY